METSNDDYLGKHSLRAAHGAPILDWSRGDYNEAPTSSFAMLTSEVASPLVDAIEKEVWGDTQLLHFLCAGIHGASPN